MTKKIIRIIRTKEGNLEANLAQSAIIDTTNKVKKRTLKLPVIIKTGEDGYFVAEVPIIPGCISQGITMDEVLANIKEAALLCLECQNDEGWIIPEKYFIDQIKVVI